MVVNTRKYSELSAQRNKLVRATSLHWFHWLIIVASLLLTLGAWHLSREQIHQKVGNQFQREADQLVELVKERMALYENALWGAVALYDSSEEVTYHEWKRYANSIRIDRRYPGINGFGVIYHVLDSDLSAFLKRQRRWQADFAVYPQREEGPYWPITFVEPESINRKAIGLDVCFEENRCAGAMRARDSASAQLTGPISLVQDEKKMPGFLFMTPFYRGKARPQELSERREQMMGVISVPFIMSNLMQGTLDRESRYVGFRISDAGQLLYDDTLQAGSDETDMNPMFRVRVDVPMYGRIWHFDIWSNEFFRKGAANFQPNLILAGGLSVDAILLLVFVFLTRANRTALKYADELTENLRAETRRLETTVTELEVARRKADDANLAKSEFLANMSHELRTPLNSILLLSQVLFDNKGRTLSEQQLQCAQVILNSSRNLNGLIDDILDLSKVEAGKMEINITACITAEIIEDLRDTFAPPAAERGLNFGVSVDAGFPLAFYSDYKRLHQILRNLIGNAVKFTHHGQVSLRFACAGRRFDGYEHRLKEDRCLAIVVEDTGIGMSAQTKQNIFEDFVQLDSGVSRKYEGTGLGLAISRRMSALLGGEIHFSSELQVGSTFVLLLPAEPCTVSELRGASARERIG